MRAFGKKKNIYMFSLKMYKWVYTQLCYILTKKITLTETAYFLNKIKSQATGPMPISKSILKHTPLKTGLHITRLYNAILSTGHFPQILKQAEIFSLTNLIKTQQYPHHIGQFP